MLEHGCQWVTLAYHIETVCFNFEINLRSFQRSLVDLSSLGCVGFSLTEADAYSCCHWARSRQLVAATPDSVLFLLQASVKTLLWSLAMVSPNQHVNLIHLDNWNMIGSFLVGFTLHPITTWSHMWTDYCFYRCHRYWSGSCAQSCWNCKAWSASLGGVW